MATIARLSAMRLQRRFAGRVGTPVLAALILACLISMGAVLWAAARLDRAAVSANQELLARVLALFERTMRRQVRDYAAWDETFEAVHLRLNEDWAEANLGPWLAQAFDIDFTFVMGPDGRTRYAWYAGTRRYEPIDQVLSDGLPLLLRESLARPASDAALAGLVRGPDGPVLVAVDAIRRADGSADLPAGERSTLVIGRAMDDAFLRELAEATGLEGLALGAAADAASLVLRAADGTPLAPLRWRQPWPGRWLRLSGLPALAVLLTLLTLFAAAMLARTQNALAALAESEARAKRIAAHDTLTGLLNRRAFCDRLAAVLASAAAREPVAVLCLDLDGFKEVNDTLGHAAGDRLLRVVASRLLGAVRERDVVARLGGDEFAVLVEGCSEPEVLERLAQRLIASVSEPCLIDDQQVVVGTSIGIALSQGANVDPSELLKQADVALYAAKNAGRGTWQFFAPEMNRALEERRRLLQDLRTALATDRLDVHYQPKIMVNTGAIVGVEALARWQHPERGAIPPAEFIPLAEESGLIDALGDWLLERACREVAATADLSLAVNLSPLQLRRANLVDRIDRILARTGFPPQRLELELTETAVIADPTTALATLEALRQRGIRIAIDDFGTGYSSLSQLQRFRFDVVKIDRSFVSRLGHDHDADAIVRAIVALGHSLGLEVVAEGVESHEQLRRLRALGAGQAQGYWTGKPMPLRELKPFLAGLPAALPPA